jgi:hypothetical protein
LGFLRTNTAQFRQKSAPLHKTFLDVYTSIRSAHTFLSKTCPENKKKPGLMEKIPNRLNSATPDTGTLSTCIHSNRHFAYIRQLFSPKLVVSA